MATGQIRRHFLESIDESVSVETMSIIEDFINDMESKFSEINQLLGDVNLELLDNIVDAKNLAEETKDGLY
jgi:hypothetical protein